MLKTDACRRLDRIAERHGVRLEWNADLAAFAAAKADLVGEPITGIFDENRYIGPGSWLAVHDLQSGNLIGIQAFRAVGDESPNLRAHLEGMLAFYPPVTLSIDPGRSVVVSDEARFIPGPIVYAGEVYVSKEARGRGLGRLLFRAGQVVVWEVYRPRCVFGLTAQARAGVAAFTSMTGFGGDEVATVQWRNRQGEVVETEGLVWSGRERMGLLAAEPLRDFEIGGTALLRTA